MLSRISHRLAVTHFQKFIVAILAGLLALAVTTRAQTLPKDSPFLPPPGAAGSIEAKAAPSTYEFIGMTVLSNATLLSINCVADKRSIWVPLGKTVNQITAVSYDPRTESAVIRADNQTLTLKMRKAVISSLAPAPVFAPTPVAPPMPPVATIGDPAPPAVPPPPMTDAEKANEARMLVSDLLEIGLRQRQAYEQAQREANARTARSTPPSDPTVAKH